MSGSAAASTRDREAYFLDYARTVRQLAGDVPLAVTGGFRSRAAIQEALRAGDCDLVGLARPTVTTPDAAAAILSDRIDVLQTRELRYGMRRVLGRFVDVKAVDGVLNISWNTDQLHRLGAGLEPDLGRGRLTTTVAMLRRNGTSSLRPKRGIR
jgi:tRNA-dihydrouridine synthase